jgi:hypothetical protein
MKFYASNHQGISQITFTAQENCDTDAWPLVPQVFFRRYNAAFDPEIGALAATVLFAGHCGTVAEFNGVKLGMDAARAVRRIAPQVEDVLTVDGVRREIAVGSASVAVAEAADAYSSGGALLRSGRVVTWSGDFVSQERRTSDQHIVGDVFTNARLVASRTRVSIALALLFAGRRVREIFVPAPPKDEADAFAAIVEGLDFVAIKLRAA